MRSALALLWCQQKAPTHTHSLPADIPCGFLLISRGSGHPNFPCSSLPARHSVWCHVTRHRGKPLLRSLRKAHT
ncbi:rCG53440, partial [Rattus norvegicus]